MTAKPFPKTALNYITKECLEPFKWVFLLCILLVLIETGVYNGLNWLFSRLIESLKQGATLQSLHHALIITGAVIFCDIINIFLPKNVLMYRQKYLYFPLQERIYGRALSYIFGHSVNYIINRQTGTLLSKTGHINAFQPTLSMLINGFWGRIADIGIKIVLLGIINIWLAVFFVLFAALVAFVNYIANKPSERLSKMESKVFSLYNGWLVDAVSNIKLVRQFNRLDYEKNRLSVLLAQYIKIKKQSANIWFASYTAVGCFVHLCSLGLLTFAIYLFSKSLIGVGDIVFVLLTLNGGFMWLMELCVLYRHFENNLAYIQGGLDPFYEPHEIEDNPDAKSLKVKKGEIEFKDVSFAYPNQEKILEGFNLKIKGGEKIGIVGLSGNGKTTLINLLQRAYDIQDGQILIDGQDIKKVTQQSLHQNLAIIAQDTTLFHRTIAENIAYGTPKVSQRKIAKAAKTAYADAFIKTLSEGYQTPVGERGYKLSGGERQRIAIARAVLRNAPILIFDEATASLDSKSESIVTDAMDNLLSHQTVIAIAHRLSTLKKMDRIIFLEHGKIIESGTFEALSLKKTGKFAHLWKLQKI